MLTVMLAMLLVLTGFLGIRLHSASTENAALKTHVAALKRQIAKLR
jgi:Tfp pilus assembly protein PilN